MWWYKLLRYWSTRDYITYITTMWLLIFSLTYISRLIQGRAPEPLYTIILSLILIPIPLLFLATIQKYSAKIEEISRYPTLLPTDFTGSKPSKKGRILTFFYAEWCPFCRRAFPLLKTLKPDSSYKIFRVDISDADNPLWDTMKIKVVPTLIAFEDGIETWRRNGKILMGLQRGDFEEADATLKTR